MTTVVGGVYVERCVEPHWDDVYGSAGRAAAAISAATPDVRLLTYRAKPLASAFASLENAYGLAIDGPEVAEQIAFDYFHPLAVPRITPRPDAVKRQSSIKVEDDIVLRFGMLEGDAVVSAGTVVYDPQSAFDPRPYDENGSTAGRLALILNQHEARRFTGDPDARKAAEALLARGDTEVVVLKMGSRGALVLTATSSHQVPAYRSENVFKIGSGDVFSAAFTQFWAIDGRSPDEAADLASRAVSRYVDTKSLPIPTAHDLTAADLVPITSGDGRIYIAAPFFNLAERWIVEEVRAQLIDMGIPVFSPLHEVGEGPGEIVAPQDLAGLDDCQVVLAILNGSDTGTVFEVGYAVARGIPVVALAQNMRAEDLKMVAGSGCTIVGDLASAIYQAVWALP
ncbi:PfkB family carbohydrate kinase [Sphingomonas sp. LB-2]|uniref:PfkB family carbohydrate kinase n=1 Tax=Sphingomonas caeni TaxID=2984949 RepID=UPI0022317007|nr:PfkB family carbohydrate kinase [Sphingomonas caeni]MCW3847386.1 PfkB family carbohydrate kinase [Sphingomonas caeni]